MLQNIFIQFLKINLFVLVINVFTSMQ